MGDIQVYCIMSKTSDKKLKYIFRVLRIIYSMIQKKILIYVINTFLGDSYGL